MGNRETNLVIVLPCFVGGGAERVAVNLGNTLYVKGINVSFIVFNNSGPLFDNINQDITIHELKVTRMRYAFIPLVKKIRELNPDVIFSTLGYVSNAVILLKPFFDKKIRIIFREANLPSSNIDSSRFPMLHYLGYRYLYKYADYIISTSKRMNSEFENNFHTPVAKLKILENPVDILSIRKHGSYLQREAGKGLRLVASGRLQKQKGFDLLIMNFNKLPEDCQLIIFGEGKEKKALEDLINSMGFSTRIKLMGFNPAPWGYYAGADIFVLPSRWEGMPNAVLEALACGTPVVATKNAGGIAEVANMTSKDAVTVAADINGLINKIKNHEPVIPNALRSSLLPEQFGVESVAERFIKLIQ